MCFLCFLFTPFSCLIILSHSDLFVFYLLLFLRCLFDPYGKGMDPDGRVSGKEVGGAGGGKTIIRTH